MQKFIYILLFIVLGALYGQESDLTESELAESELAESEVTESELSEEVPEGLFKASRDKLMEQDLTVYIEWIVEGESIALFISAAAVLLVLLGSAAISSTIAESKLRGPRIHFVAGLLLPVAYPIFAFSVLKPPVDHVEEVDENGLRVTGPPPSAGGDKMKIGQSDESGFISEETMETKTNVYNQIYFQTAMYDGSGNHRGPFMMVIEGNEVRFERISQADSDFVVIETINSTGKQQTLRIPYPKIDSVKEI